MMRLSRLTPAVLATVGILAGSLMFTAAPALAAAPAVTAQGVEFVAPQEAGVIAKVNGGEESSECHVQYGTVSVSEHEVPCEQGATLPEDGEQFVTGTVTGLQPVTLYHFRFVVKNATGEAKGPGNAAEEQFTTLALVKPEVESEGASVKATQATLEAHVNPDYQKTTYEFEYATNKALTGAKTISGAAELSGGAGQLASVALSGLEEGGTYYYRVIAENETSENEGKPVAGPVQSFTTVTMPHTDPVTAIGVTTATFNGHMTLNSLNTTVPTQFYFDYNPSATECVNGPQSTPGEAGTGSGLVKEKAEVSELQPNATYSVCFVTSNAFGSEVDPSTPLVQFKTLAAPPKIDSQSSSGVALTEATLEAQVNPNNQKTSGYLQYSTSPAVNAEGSLIGATTTTASELGEAYGDQPVGPTVLTGLTADQAFYYQAVAPNATGTTYGPVQTFTTQGAPLVSTGEAQNITRNTATLAGTVNPTGVETSYYFAYISEAGYQPALASGAANPYAEGETTAPTINSSDEAQTVAPTLASGMLPGTTYHYALIAKNNLGLTIGPDHTLTTLAGTPPIVTTGGASAISQNSATLSGTVATNSLQSSYGFEISTAPFQPGTLVPATGLGSIGGAATQGVSATLSELQPGTTYYYRIEASNADGTERGQPASFTTPGFPTLIAPPASPPLIGTPNIAFPKEEKASGTGTAPKALTKAEKLKKALKACHAKKSKSARAKCEKQARGKFGASGKKKGRRK